MIFVQVRASIMKNPTIWETASRPLFVRTVWLEGSELRRGLQRYFVWDYDTKRSTTSPLQHNRADNLKPSISLELNDFADCDFSNEGEEEAFLIGSAKAKLHEPFKLDTNKKSKLVKHRRRSSLFNRQYQSYDSYKDISRRPSVISLLNSGKNSFIQPQQIAETDDVLLAERVLHWLDLAGKEDFLKNLHELNEMEVKLSKTCRLRQDAIKRYNNKAQNNSKSKPHKTKSYERAVAAAPQAPQSTQRNSKAAEAVKHITIIFNKEGQPIRLNRPAKNIDLCALSTSPSTTRKLVGTLASARLYKSAENARHLNVPKTPYTNTKSKTGNGRRRLDTVADLNNSTLQKRLLENTVQRSYNNLHDSKKQLHIFMPTLLKKGLNKSVYGTEDGISELSHNFSELCRI